MTKPTVAWVDDDAAAVEYVVSALTNLVPATGSSTLRPLGELYNFIAVPVAPDPLPTLKDRAVQRLSVVAPSADIVLVDLSFDNNNDEGATRIGADLANHIRSVGAWPRVGVYSRHPLTAAERAILSLQRFDLVLTEVRTMVEQRKQVMGQFWTSILDGALAATRHSSAGSAEPTVRRPPHPARKTFVGCASENLCIAEFVQADLLRHKIDARIWTHVQPRVSTFFVDQFLKDLDEYSYGVLIFGTEDIVLYRDSIFFAARDNVILELGMFLGRHGRLRSLIMAPNTVEARMPSDLTGITVAFYPAAASSDRGSLAAVQPAAVQIRNAILSDLDIAT